MARVPAWMREGQELLTKLLMKYDLMSKTPFDCGRERISRSQLHMIEAIGKGYGRTVTSLADYFMVTKGAVSQVIKKLCCGGFVAKEKGEGKEILLRLTKKGLRAFDLHESYADALPELAAFAANYSEKEIRIFLRVLRDLDEMSSRIFVTLAEEGRIGASARSARSRTAASTGKK